MKPNWLHITFSLLFSALFLLAGTGYNVVQFCCNDCEKAGIETVAETSCMSIHEHHCHDEATTHEHSEEMMACVHELHKSCDLKRLSVDVPSMHNPNYEFTDYSLVVIDLDNFTPEIPQIAEAISETRFIHSPPEIFIPLKGRQILCQKSVLII